MRKRRHRRKHRSRPTGANSRAADTAIRCGASDWTKPRGEQRPAIERANWLLWTAHNLERFADRVTNICERTVFVVTGELSEINDTDSEFWKQK